MYQSQNRSHMLHCARMRGTHRRTSSLPRLPVTLRIISLFYTRLRVCTLRGTTRFRCTLRSVDGLVRVYRFATRAACCLWIVCARSVSDICSHILVGTLPLESHAFALFRTFCLHSAGIDGRCAQAAASLHTLSSLPFFAFSAFCIFASVRVFDHSIHCAL